MSSPPPGTLIAFIDKTNNKVVAAAVVALDGSVNIKVPKGSYTVIAAHKDYLVWQQDVEVTEDTALNIVLQKVPEITVRCAPRLVAEKAVSQAFRTSLTAKVYTEVTST